MYCLNVQSKKAVCALKYYYIYRGKKLANISCGFDHCNSGSFMHPIFFLKFDRSISKKHEYFNSSVLVYIHITSNQKYIFPCTQIKTYITKKSIDVRQLEHYTTLSIRRLGVQIFFRSDFFCLYNYILKYFTKVMFFHRSQR